jgi:manganese efflux pump family protein
MGFFEILLISIGLAMDAFAVALGAGTSGHGRRARPAVRLAFHLGLFQFLMPVVGWLVGVRLARLIQDYDHWVAFGLLVFVGGHMLWESFQRDHDELPADPTRGLRMVTLSVATSLDALAVGVSLAMLNITIWYPSAVIGLVTGALSLIGIYLGNRLRGNFGKRMELVGGLVLIAIGLRILMMHVG